MSRQQLLATDRRTVGAVMGLVSAACFGTLAIFGKIATEVGLSTTTLLVFRFLVGAALLWAGLAVTGRATLLDRRESRAALALGVLYALFTGFYFWGLLFIPAGLTGLVFYTYPVYVYVLAVWLLDEPLSGRKVGALALALGGVGLIVGGDPDAVDFVGVALVLLAALGLAGYVVGSRAALATADSDAFSGTVLVGTAGAFLLFGGGTGRLTLPSGLDQWLVVLGIGAIGTAVPMFLYIAALDRIQASHASVLGTAEPLVTVVLGIVVLGEAPSWLLFVGGGLILAGVLIIQTDS
ncbi:Threonine/homoserine efflux transporter RhtA [Halovenus aranensis]|uniref:Threonine/homoserine efflux transporter RhtA n=1 Tax=Halovenus aranensis TaxID=890420 RepID=A0A1G8WKS6_9EURY|nr:DMT family transporter [Halovenus aranensis]SDJ78265.1 Threonine/homoserine efflux transporter RhtA [Halovenus aranensis]